MTTSGRDRLKSRTKRTPTPPVKVVAAQPKTTKKPSHHDLCNCKDCHAYNQANATQVHTREPQAKASTGGTQRKRGKSSVPDQPQEHGDSAQRDRKPKARKVSDDEQARATEPNMDDGDAGNTESKRKPGNASQAKRSSDNNGGGKTKPTPRKARATVKNHPRPNLPVAEGIPIYVPGKDILFDGKVRVMSTCRDCNEIMQVIYPTAYVHPCCTPKPTVLESLTQGWLTTVEAGDDEAAELTQQEITERESRPPDLGRAALIYAEWGWPVFPLMPGTKEPATGNGFKDATTKASWIRKWWERNPQYNIGLATGLAFDVLDVDPDAGGAQSFTELLDKAWFQAKVAQGVCVTANGGLHLYFSPTGKGNRAGFAPGLDYRGEGGYVVAPPSNLGTQQRSWSWLCVPSPDLKEEAF